MPDVQYVLFYSGRGVQKMSMLLSYRNNKHHKFVVFSYPCSVALKHLPSALSGHRMLCFCVHPETWIVQVQLLLCEAFEQIGCILVYYLNDQCVLHSVAAD